MTDGRKTLGRERSSLGIVQLPGAGAKPGPVVAVGGNDRYFRLASSVSLWEVP